MEIILDFPVSRIKSHYIPQSPNMLPGGVNFTLTDDLTQEATSLSPSDFRERNNGNYHWNKTENTYLQKSSDIMSLDSTYILINIREPEIQIKKENAN